MKEQQTAIKETDISKYENALLQPNWIQGLKVFDYRAICDRCGEIQPKYGGLQLIDRWNAYHFSRSCITRPSEATEAEGGNVPRPVHCEHTDAEHAIFDKGLRNEPLDSDSRHLREIWRIGNSRCFRDHRQSNSKGSGTVKRNQYWTIKYSNGWLDNHYVRYTRRDAIDAYLSEFRAGVFSGNSWAWHKQNKKVRAVRVQMTEVKNEQ